MRQAWHERRFAAHEEHGWRPERPHHELRMLRFAHERSSRIPDRPRAAEHSVAPAGRHGLPAHPTLLPPTRPRHWRHLLRERERLLRKLAWLERRLAARRAHALMHRLPVEVFEIDGRWFRQVLHRRPRPLTS